MRAKALTALGFTAAGLGCVTGAFAEGLRYSPWGNPGALDTAVQLAALALACLAVPAVMTLVWAVRQARQSVQGLGLTPAQAAVGALALAEIVQEIWAEANDEEARRLTASVMGPVRGGSWPASQL